MHLPICGQRLSLISLHYCTGHRYLKAEHQIFRNAQGADAYKCNKLVRASVRAIIHSLMLVDYLPVQTYKPYSNYGTNNINK